MNTHIVVIGGGPGGYPAAFLLAQKKAKVTLIERDKLGGTCLNRGCIPTKLLLYVADILRKIKRGKSLGIKPGKVNVDLKHLDEQKNKIVTNMRKSIEKLCNVRGVTLIKGTAEFVTDTKIRIRETGSIINADAAIIATGSTSKTLPVPGAKRPGIIYSNEALSISNIPPSIAIIGGGYIGVEFAQIYNSLGSKVTIIEMLPTILANADKDISLELSVNLRNEGINIIAGSHVDRILESGKKKVIILTSSGKERKLETTKILIAAGRKPNTDSMGLEHIGIQTEKGFIKVNDRMQTNVNGIYAIGDVIGGVMSAHAATAEGNVAVANILGDRKLMNYSVVPSCIYTYPEIAYVGLNENEAKQSYGEILVGRFPFQYSGKARIMNGQGFVKIIAEKSLGRVIGVHLIGPQVTEMISEAVIAMNLESTFEDLAHSIHPHPTLSEAIMEAALSIEGVRINSN